MKNIFDYVNEYFTTYSMTENGAIGYASSGNDLADFLFKISSYRHDANLLVKDLNNILEKRNENLLKFIFYIRDIREGLGERDSFRIALAVIFSDTSKVKNKEELFRTILPLIPYYGRYDDLFIFFNTKYEDELVSYIRKELEKDVRHMESKEEVSLLAKWLPSVNSSSKKTKALAKHLVKKLGTTEKDYRKLLSKLRSYLKIIEVKMCANEWNRIDYNAVPSNANRIYKDAFLRHDAKRRNEYLSKLERGDKDVKMNSSVNFPHDILAKYRSQVLDFLNMHEPKIDIAVEQMWKNLKDIKGLDNTIVVRDDSGSMLNFYNGLIPYEVATALAIYCAERLNEGYKNKVITFSHTPKFLECNQDSLLEKYVYLHKHSEVSNTNIKAVFDLILNVAVTLNLKQADLPNNILIISDMEFDYSTTAGFGKLLFESIKESYENKGYKLPRLIFWNVASRSHTIPVKENENGVLLISGFSPNVITLFNSGDVSNVDVLINNIVENEHYLDIPKLEYLD